MEIIGQGAEAILKHEDGVLVKDRIVKKYRIKEIDDKIRKLRTRSETKLLEKASKIIPIPKVLDSNDKTMQITMEFIDGKKLSEYLDGINDKEREKLLKIIGNQTALLHNENIIHGDLTTSNMILKDEKIYFIDFGLGFFSIKNEDKAVDIHLFRQALESKHYTHFEKSYDNFLKGYKEKFTNYNEIIKQLEKVEKRGRYKGKNEI
ncbi:MAG: KEOPS complex kinase/ATPase Bud32 [Candidatus Nanoarchaeia archaeon]